VLPFETAIAYFLSKLSAKSDSKSATVGLVPDILLLNKDFRTENLSDSVNFGSKTRIN